MKKLLLLVILLVWVVFASIAIAIQKPAPEPDRETPASTEPGKIMKFSGVIIKVEKEGIAIVVKGKMMKEGKVLTFFIDGKTKIRKGKTAMSPLELKKDMQVLIEYKKEKDKMVAVAIEVSSP